MRKIPAKSYLNYMKYSYKNKDIRKFIEKPSTRRKTLKNYKLQCLCNFFTIMAIVATTCIGFQKRGNISQCFNGLCQKSI